MASDKLNLGIEYFNDPETGRPLASGQVYIGQVDLDPAILANRVTVTLEQEDGSSVSIAPSAQPLTIGAGGRIMYSGSPVAVTVDGAYSVKVLDNLASQIYYVAENNAADADTGDTGVLVLNGSFENQTVTAGLPDDWTLNIGENGSIAIDSVDQAHGLNSLKFTGTDATGGGTATSNLFDVLKGGSLYVNFTYKSSAVDTLNKVQVKYYTELGAVVSTDTVYSEGTANPASYTEINAGSDVPATAVQAQVILTGVDGSGTTTTGTTNFDDVSVAPKNIGLINTTDNNQRIDASGTTNEQEFYLGSSGLDTRSRLRLETDSGNLSIYKTGSAAGGAGNALIDNESNNDVFIRTGSTPANKVAVQHAGGLTVYDDAPATPTANTMYADSMVKAWAGVAGVSGTPVLSDGFNVSATIGDGGVGAYNVDLITSLTAAGYGLATAESLGIVATVSMPTNSDLNIRLYSPAASSAVDGDCTAMAFGAQ